MVFLHHIARGLPEPLLRETRQGVRCYQTPEGMWYPSMTTVLGFFPNPSLEAWKQRVGPLEAARISRQATTQGTAVHALCEVYLNNALSDARLRSAMPLPKSLFLPIKQQLDISLGAIWALEQTLYSNQLRVAGQCDLIGEWNGRSAVIDFKTSRRRKTLDQIESYFIQCAGYALMFEERTEQTIQDLVIILTSPETPVADVFILPKTKYSQPLITLVSEYWKVKALQS